MQAALLWAASILVGRASAILGAEGIIVATARSVRKVPFHILRTDGGPVAVRMGGQEFACEEEGQTVIPKLFLAGFRLADIPEDITIKPVESIEGNTIDIHNDIEFCRTEDGSTIAFGRADVPSKILERRDWPLALRHRAPQNNRRA